jgi:hypothetical protein
MICRKFMSIITATQIAKEQKLLKPKHPYETPIYSKESAAESVLQSYEDHHVLSHFYFSKYDKWLHQKLTCTHKLAGSSSSNSATL